MNRSGYHTIFLSGMVLLSLLHGLMQPANAQAGIVNLESDSIRVTDFIHSMEQNYELVFYYDELWFTDSSWTSVDLKNADPETAVKTFFKNFDIQVYMRDREVFLTKNLVVNPVFANGFNMQIREASSSPSFRYNNIIAISESQQRNRFSDFEVIQFGAPSAAAESKEFRIAGMVTEMGTGEPVIGATIQVAGTGAGTATDAEGYYEITASAGKHEIIIRAIGRQTTRRQVSLYASGKMDVEMAEDIREIEEVVVVGKAEDRVNALVGAEKLDLALVKKSVMVMGEIDIMKGLLSMPGVQTITEVSNGYNVRGGSTDQNLILIDDIPIINATHFFGFFSSFNSDLVEEATLYKSGIPADMGGRISSILDIHSKKGNKESFAAVGGISPVTARFAVEGPIIKNRLSFVAGGRSTYSDWLMNRINDARINNSSAWFYDGFVNLDLDLTDETSLSATIYHSNDYFQFDDFLTNQYANLGGSLIMNTRTGERMTYQASLTYSEYDFSIKDIYNPAFASRSSYEIVQYGLNNSFRWSLSRWVNLNFGINGILYKSAPGEIDPSGDASFVTPVSLEDEQAAEAAIFMQNEQHITRWLSLSYGLRYSGFVNMGPGGVYLYDPDYSRSVSSITDTVYFGAGSTIKRYGAPEFRFLAKIMTGNNSSVKISYNRMHQYLNLISNTITPAPTDIWKLSDYHFRPQEGDQFSIGFYTDLIKKPTNILSLSIESYYKTSDNILDFKVGAELFANDHFETEVMTGINRSYGIELQLSKERGSFYGWANYTYARSLNRFLSDFPEENINYGAWHPSNHDKPHQVKAVMNYDFYRRMSLSANVNYSTGRPVTLPVTAFMFGGTKRIQFAERNQHRMPDYFRLDLSFTLDGRYQIEKPAHGSFTVSVVNVTGRKNPYSVFFQYDERGRLQAYYLSIFGVPIATLTYNLKF